MAKSVRFSLPELAAALHYIVASSLLHAFACTLLCYTPLTTEGRTLHASYPIPILAYTPAPPHVRHHHSSPIATIAPRCLLGLKFSDFDLPLHRNETRSLAIREFADLTWYRAGYIYLSIHLFIHPSIHASIHLLTIHLFMYLFTILPISPSSQPTMA